MYHNSFPNLKVIENKMENILLHLYDKHEVLSRLILWRGFKI